MAQKGYLKHNRTSWNLCYREPQADGSWKERSVVIASYKGQSKASVRGKMHDEIEKLLAPINATNHDSSKQDYTASTQPLGKFIELVYFPGIDGKKKPSTIFGYRHIFEKHLKPRPEMNVRLRDFRTVNAQRLFFKIEEETKLSHQSLKNIRAFLWAVFTHAAQIGAFDDEKVNPISKTEIPEGETSEEETYAYNLDEILSMLEVLPEPAKTVVATAAFTGLRRAEIRGLKWGDFTGDELKVRRAVWNTHITDTKTKASKAGVPVIPNLQEQLEEHRNGHGADAFIFAGEKMNRPLNLANLARRVIAPTLKANNIEWHGWHAFRRGLGTNLRALGIELDMIQAILRHANLATTMAHYVKPDPAKKQAAMAKLQKALKDTQVARNTSAARRQTA